MQVTKPSTTGGSWILKQRSILQPVPFARPDSRECRRCGRSTCAKSVSYVPGSKAGIPKKSCAHVVLKHWTPVEVLLARSRENELNLRAATQPQLQSILMNQIHMFSPTLPFAFLKAGAAQHATHAIFSLTTPMTHYPLLHVSHVVVPCGSRCFSLSSEPIMVLGIRRCTHCWPCD